MAKHNTIILHGWGSHPTRWKKVSKKIAQSDTSLKVYVPLLPGFDRKGSLKEPYTIEDYSHWLDNFIRQKKIDRPVLVGHSNGGRIAIHYSVNHQDHVAKLVLVGAAGIPPNNQLRRVLFKFLAIAGKVIVSAFHSKALDSLAKKTLYKIARESDYLRANPVMKKTMQNLLSYDTTDDLKKIKIPTLIVWGRYDRTTPLWMGEQMRALIKNSRLAVLEGEHNLHRALPKRLSQLIVDFVQV